MRIHQVPPNIYHIYPKNWANRDWMIRYFYNGIVDGGLRGWARVWVVMVNWMQNRIIRLFSTLLLNRSAIWHCYHFLRMHYQRLFNLFDPWSGLVVLYTLNGSLLVHVHGSSWQWWMEQSERQRSVCWAPAVGSQGVSVRPILNQPRHLHHQHRHHHHHFPHFPHHFFIISGASETNSMSALLPR